MDASWYVRDDDGEEYGPYSLAEMGQCFREKRVLATSLSPDCIGNGVDADSKRRGFSRDLSRVALRGRREHVWSAIAISFETACDAEDNPARHAHQTRDEHYMGDGRAMR